MGQLRPGSPRPSQGRAAERGARDPSARAPAQRSPVPRLQGRASRWGWGCGGRWGWSAGRRAGSGQRVRLGRRLALRPSIGRNQLCRSLWLTSSSLLRRAAAIGRATPTSASSAGGFFKGEADRSVRREPPPGLAQTALARTIPPTTNFNQPHRSGPLCRVHLGGGTAGEPRGGVRSSWVLCSAMCASVCVHVPACVCA